MQSTSTTTTSGPTSPPRPRTSSTGSSRLTITAVSPPKRPLAIPGSSPTRVPLQRPHSTSRPSSPLPSRTGSVLQNIVARLLFCLPSLFLHLFLILLHLQSAPPQSILLHLKCRSSSVLHVPPEPSRHQRLLK